MVELRHPHQKGQDIMPIIAMFLGILIRMQYNDHNPPHFHAEYQGHKASFTIEGELLAGEMPPRQMKFIAAWAELHKDELLANWEASRENQELFRIESVKF